ncbi:NAD-dependent epimerase/dehydratase family protein [Glacieibacterium sp.]|uniref:NAD-dependent epimerase/dehydratase family protein n=1 Tax=Glacieibacterium sp. TaxID=2860237 RepID=UPI003AFFB778
MAAAASGQRTLIIGGAGFVGAHLAARRLARGDAVHIAVRPTTGLERLGALRSSITLHSLTLTDRPAVDALIAEARPDTIFHLANTDRRQARDDLSDATLSITDDLAGLLALVAACSVAREPPRVMVRAGSLAEYGPVAAPFVETQREMPTTGYAAALVAGTCYARMLAPRLPFALVTARLALIYGPAQSDRFLIPQLITNCLAGLPTTIQRPRDRRDLIHVDDAVDGLEMLAAHPTVPLVNIASGHAPTVVEIAARICGATGADPGLLQLGPSDAPGGTPLFLGSSKLARRVLGWSPRTDMDQGIARTVDWYRDNAVVTGIAA